MGGSLRVPEPETGGGQTFLSLDMAVRAAVLGEGIAMGDLTLLQEDFATGQLVVPFPDLVLSNETEDYSFFAREEMWDEPRIAAFRTWLREECGAAAIQGEPDRRHVSQGARHS